MQPCRIGKLIVATVVENPGIGMPFADFLPSLAAAQLESERARDRAVPVEERLDRGVGEVGQGRGTRRGGVAQLADEQTRGRVP